MSKRNQALLMLAPLAVFITILFFLWRGLSLQPELLPSTLVGKPVPAFHLRNLNSPTYPFTEQDLKGQVSLLNVWATWCYACEMEHAMLMSLKESHAVAIYGIAYKDDAEQTKKYLAKHGNPFTMVGDDSQGEVAIDLGVYGTPETFIVDKQGIIVHRHVGIISPQVWQNELLPIIKALI